MKAIFRTKNSGVFYGTLTNKEISGDCCAVKINDCIRLWYWKGANSLSEMAERGVKYPDECKFSVVTNHHEVFGVIEIIPCTEIAMKSIEGVKAWKH